jgi:hypothetical protein
MHLNNHLKNEHYYDNKTSDFSHPLKSVNKSLIQLNYDHSNNNSNLCPKSVHLYSSNTFLPCLKSISTDINISKNCYSSSPVSMSSTSDSSETITSPTNSQQLSSNQSSFIFTGSILNDKNSFRPIKHESLHNYKNKSTSKPSVNIIKPNSTTTPQSASFSFLSSSDSSSHSSNDSSQLLKQKNHYKSTLSINLSNRYKHNSSFNSSRIIYINNGDSSTCINQNKSNSLDRHSSSGHTNICNRSSSMNRIKSSLNNDIQLGLTPICTISNYGKRLYRNFIFECVISFS